MEDHSSLVQQLISTEKECEWLEFKVNYHQPSSIGKYISALSNSATLLDRDFGYIIFGVEDHSRKIVGTSFNIASAKVKQENLENWLVRFLSPAIFFEFHRVIIDKLPIVIVKIPKARHHPVRFDKIAYIRVGSYTKKLHDFPDREKVLWKKLETVPFETSLVIQSLTQKKVLSLIDCDSYFKLLNRPEKHGSEKLMALSEDQIIKKSDDQSYSITCMGALLFAQSFRNFNSLEHKKIRIIQYQNCSYNIVKEHHFDQGYACEFEDLIDEIAQKILPDQQIILGARRMLKPRYSQLALRELIANAIIHQDYSIDGVSSKLEVFDNHIQITNPGKPLISIDRFISSPPRSRNPLLARMMRRLGFCEELGSGWVKVISEVEQLKLPPPQIQLINGNTRVILKQYKPFNQYTRSEWIEGLYQHACLKYRYDQALTNSSARKRFDVEKRNSSVVSRMIVQAIKEHKLIIKDPDASMKNREYIPYWAH